MYNHEYFKEQLDQREIDNNRYNINVELTPEEIANGTFEIGNKKLLNKKSFHSFEVCEYSIQELFEYSEVLQNDIKEILLKSIKEGSLKCKKYNFRWMSPDLNHFIETLKKVEIFKIKKLGTVSKVTDIKKAA